MHVLRSTPCATLAAILGLGLSFAMADQARVLKHHKDNIYQFDVTADGQWIATVSGDNTAAIWDLQTGEVKHSLPHGGPVYTADFSPNGQRLATGSGDGATCVSDGTSAGGDCNNDGLSAASCTSDGLGV